MIAASSLSPKAEYIYKISLACEQENHFTLFFDDFLMRYVKCPFS